MAKYNPVQPFWKRAIAGVLDFLVAFVVIGNIVQFGVNRTAHGNGQIGQATKKIYAEGPGFDLDSGPAALVIALTVAYFVVLGRTGGTLFQRLFGFKRA